MESSISNNPTEGLPFFEEASTGIANAEGTPEGIDEAGRAHLSGLTQFIVSLFRTLFARERESMMTELKEAIPEAQIIERQTAILNNTLEIHRYGWTYYVNWIAVIVGCIVGLIVALYAIDQINSSPITLSNGQQITVASAFDKTLIEIPFTLFVTAGFGALAGFLTPYRGERI